MIWIGSLTAAGLLAGLGVFCVIMKKRIPFVKNGNTMLILGAAVFLSCVALSFPVFLQGDDPVYAILQAVSHSIRMFVVDTAIADLTDGLAAAGPGGLYLAYKTAICLMYIIAPLFTLGVIAEYFGELREYLYIRIMWRRKKYIFSQLNERSCLLAESIAERNRQEGVRALYVFCNIDEGREDDFDTLIRKARDLRAVLLSRNELELPFWKNRKTGEQDVFFEIDINENRNLQNAIHLIEKAETYLSKEEQNNAHIYVFSNKREAEIVLDAVEKNEVRVRLLDPQEFAVYQLLFEHPLYENFPHGEDQIRILIAGCGHIGQEVLKAVIWCGQMHSLGLSVTVADRNASEICRYIRHECPELLDGDYTLEFIDGDIFDGDFDEIIKDRLADITYCVVALGEDERNIRAAIDLRRIYRYMHMKYAPAIALHITDPNTAAAIRSLREKSTVDPGAELSYELIPFGCMRDFYNYNLLGAAGYEALALNVHLQYCSDITGKLYGDDQKKAKADAVRSYYSRQGNIRSSRANALHIKYKLWELGYEMKEQSKLQSDTEEWSAEFQETVEDEKTMAWLADMEHRRWMAFYYAEGWRKADMDRYEQYCTVFKGFDPLGKCHPCLVPTEELETLDKMVPEIFQKKNGRSYHPGYVESDIKLIRFIPMILQDHWGITGQKYRIVKREQQS